MTTFISFISGGSTMKFAILILAATTLSAQTPAQQTKKAAPPRDGIPASHGDDTRGYNDTPQLPNQKWKVHDMERPRAPKVVPGPLTNAAPPSDAVVLFDGKDLSHWMQTVRGGQPKEATGSGQGRGNSGVELMGRYEIQVLESNENLTYADGAAGAMYGTWPPLANPARPQGEWNAYDIMFEAPRFADGKLVKPAYFTVLFNGVLVQNHMEQYGTTIWRQVPKYTPHAAEESLSLQDHSQPVRYRNIWIRRLAGSD